MNKISALIIALIAIAAIIGTTACSSDAEFSLPEGASITSTQNVISVSGEGKVYATPDLATLNLGVQSKADTVDEARTQAADAMDKVMQSLTNDGIAEKDIQTSSFTIYPITKWDPDTQEEIQTGFRVTNILTVKIRDLESIGSVIDDAANAGRDLIQVQNISFSIEDPTPYKDEARQMAVAAAKAKAEQLAELAEVQLGKAMQISESEGYYPPVVRLANAVAFDTAEAGGYSTDISPGQQEVTITVQISYAIE